jgi:hypothetical protein
MTLDADPSVSLWLKQFPRKETDCGYSLTLRIPLGIPQAALNANPFKQGESVEWDCPILIVTLPHCKFMHGDCL